MATSLINPYNLYTGNGAATEFAVNFPYLDRAYVGVYLKRFGENEVKLTTDDYEFVSDTVIRFPKTGSALAVLGINDKLAFQRETPVENEYVFDNQKRLFPVDVMNADDKSYQILQEQAQQLSKALKMSATSSANPDELIPLVETVAANIDSVEAVATNITDISTVALNVSDVNDVADNITNVNAVATNETNINAVSGIASDVTSVAGNATDISAVAGNATNINTVAGVSSNVTTVAGSIASVNSVAGDLTNIDAVASDLTNIDSASTYANNASIWAEGTDVQVAALGGEHSAKTWSQSNKRNIGEIIESIIPLTDAGLHLLDGALISGSGSYSAFVTYIAGLVSDYPDLFETEANWQSAVTTYGVCGKFVYDNVNNTIRLPKITGIIEGTTDATALGDLVAAGLPNITGTLYSAIGYENCSGAFEIKGSGTGTYSMANRDSQQGYYRTFNAAKSSSIYGNSSTVQPQTIKAFYYIVVANSVKTDIEVDIDQIATDLNNKADTTLIDAVSGAFENVVALANASGKAVVDSWGMPDYSAGVSKTVSTTYTAEANGCLHVVAQRNASNQGTLTVVIGSAVFRIRSNDYSWDTIILPVPKGWTYAWYNDGNLTVAEVTYFPCIGG